MLSDFPVLPNEHAIAAMLLTLVALFLYARDDVPLEVTSIGLLAALTVGFSLYPFEDAGRALNPIRFFQGFANEGLIAVCGLMVVGQGLVATAALEPVGHLLSKGWGRVPMLSLLAVLLAAATVSAFVNNTPVVVLLLPILVGVCLRTGTAPSGVLMPMGFATVIGGTVTTIGSSTNLLAASVAADLGMMPLEMFDFALPAIGAGSLGLLYLWLVAPRLLPHRDIEIADTSPRLFEARIELRAGSVAVGKTVAEAVLLAGEDLRVLRIRRGDTFLYPLPDVRLKAGDRLRVTDTPSRLKRFEAALQGTLYGGDAGGSADNPLRAQVQALAEIAVVQGSVLDRVTLRHVRFLDRFQLAVVAIHRAGREVLTPSEDIRDVTLAPGDILLVQGAREHIRALKRTPDFLVLDGSVELPSTSRAPLALAILAAVVTMAALDVMPIAVSALTGATAMVLTRCLDMPAALRAIPPSVFFVIVASLALGRALIETGATDYITEVYLAVAAGAPPVVVLSGLMALLAVLTNVVSNNAAAVIGTPIGVAVAEHLALPPEPFVLAVLFGANMSFCTPMAYQTNLLVMAAGNYRFAEFVKVGLPLTLILWLSLTWLLDALYL